MEENEQKLCMFYKTEAIVTLKISNTKDAVINVQAWFTVGLVKIERIKSYKILISYKYTL